MEDENGNTVSKNIEEIEAGDNVWSRDEATGEECFKPVVETYVRETDMLVHLSYKREARSSRRSEEKGGNADDGDGPATLIGTAEHPFWSLTRNQWVNMGELAAGERLRLDNGSAIVTGVKEKVLAAPVKVYNFQVADHHTYFAAPANGEPFVWVHNANYKIAQEFAEQAKNEFASVRNIADDADIGVRGSLARGFKGQHKGSAAFDPSNFDVDAFIVSDKLAGMIRSNAKGIRWASRIPALAQIERRLERALRSSNTFAGLRADRFKFRVFSRQEISNLLGDVRESQFWIRR